MAGAPPGRELAVASESTRRNQKHRKSAYKPTPKPSLATPNTILQLRFFYSWVDFSPILPILTPSCPFWAAWNQQGKQPPQTTLRAPYGAKNTPNPTPNHSQTHPKQLPTPLHNFEKSSYGGDFHPFWPFLPPSYPLREPKFDPKIDQKTRFSQIWVDYGQNRPGKSPTHIEASFSQLFSTIGTQNRRFCPKNTQKTVIFGHFVISEPRLSIACTLIFEFLSTSWPSFAPKTQNYHQNVSFLRGSNQGEKIPTTP